MSRHVNICHDTMNQCPFVRFQAPLAYNAPKLDALDIHFHVNPKHCDDEDTIVFQRPTAASTFEMIREAYGRWKAPVILEFDDALWDMDIYEHADNDTKKRALKAKPDMLDVIANHCDGIVCSTSYLANKLSKITDKPICIMGNAVNPNYAPTEHTKTILYAGAGDRNRDFSDEWIDAIKDMKSKGYKFVSTTNLGIEDEHLGIVQYGDHANRLRHYAPEYYIAPLEDSELNRGRSNLKELEAASIGAKFLGGIGVEPDFTKAKVPTLEREQDYTTNEYVADFMTAYAGLWLMTPEQVKTWKRETNLFSAG